MTIGLCFWVLWVTALVFGYALKREDTSHSRAYNLLLFVLFGLLGWAVFGPPLKG